MGTNKQKNQVTYVSFYSDDVIPTIQVQYLEDSSDGSDDESNRSDQELIDPIDDISNGREIDGTMVVASFGFGYILLLALIALFLSIN